MCPQLGTGPLTSFDIDAMFKQELCWIVYYFFDFGLVCVAFVYFLVFDFVHFHI